MLQTDEHFDPEDSRIRRAFEQLEPEEEQKQKMYRDIISGRQPCRKKTFRRGVAAALIAASVVVSGVGVEAATGGGVLGEGVFAATGQKTISAIRELCGWDAGSKEIADQVKTVQDVEVYAPEIFALDEKLLIFGGRGGILIYDREAGQVAATIDVQKIDSFHFNTGSQRTHVLRQGNALYIFNSENGKVYGNSYRYSLKNLAVKAVDAASEDAEGAAVRELAVQKVSSEKKQTQKLYDSWAKTDQNEYEDTFDIFEDFVQTDEQKASDGVSTYSERSICWENSAGEEMISFIWMDYEGQYHLYTKDRQTGGTTDEKILFANASEGQTEQPKDAEQPAVSGETVDDKEPANEDGNAPADRALPPFRYSGDDPALKAISDYLTAEEADDDEQDGSICIPAPVIFKQVKKNGELLVFGNFYTYGYVKNGKLLEDTYGGEMPACFHLKKSGDEYTVARVDRTGDGAGYLKGIKEFTKGFPGLWRKYTNLTNEQINQVRTEWIRMYVQDNGLDITHYYDFGWDPVEIAP